LPPVPDFLTKVAIIATFLRNYCIDEVKNPNKFSIIAGRNPDIILVDQLALIVRYVYKKGKLLQVFCVVSIISHSSEHEDKIT